MSLSEDQFEIQSLTQRYADAVMRRNADDWAACWATDGAWDLGQGEPIRGRENIKATWIEAMGGLSFVIFLVQPTIAKIDGDKATARSYVQETLQAADGTQFRVVGVYNDDIVREDGAWKFQGRSYHVLYRGPVDLSGEQSEYPSEAA